MSEPSDLKKAAASLFDSVALILARYSSVLLLGSIVDVLDFFCRTDLRVGEGEAS